MCVVDSFDNHVGAKRGALAPNRRQGKQPSCDGDEFIGAIRCWIAKQ